MALLRKMDPELLNKHRQRAQKVIDSPGDF